MQLNIDRISHFYFYWHYGWLWERK